jgi:peptidoglycan/xylan/chitin deacetylase (PgdA/CDA1 family)
MLNRLLNKIKTYSQHKAIVLLYHRIANIETDPWQLAVSPANFDEHLRLLKQDYNVISLDQLSKQIQNDKLGKRNICITFDDGYADNYYSAKPLLAKHELPATFFISTGYTDSRRMFWWDELEKIILHSPNLPEQMDLVINSSRFQFQPIENELTEKLSRLHKKWVWNEQAPSDRALLYLKLWTLLRPLPDVEITTCLMAIGKWASSNTKISESCSAMSSLQLKEIANDPLFTLGAHTENHPDLSCHSKQHQFEELSSSITYIQNLSNSKVNYLSYPYGEFN